jgi:hypothetical protein
MKNGGTPLISKAYIALMHPQNITSDSRSKYARPSYGHLLWQLRELNVIIVFSG